MGARVARGGRPSPGQSPKKESNPFWHAKKRTFNKIQPTREGFRTRDLWGSNLQNNPLDQMSLTIFVAGVLIAFFGISILVALAYQSAFCCTWLDWDSMAKANPGHQSDFCLSQAVFFENRSQYHATTASSPPRARPECRVSNPPAQAPRSSKNRLRRYPTALKSIFGVRSPK